MTPEEKRRIAVARRIAGKECGPGSGKLYTVEEMARRVEFELEKRQVAYRNKRHRLPPARGAKREQEIADFQRTIHLLRRDSRLCAIGFQIPPGRAGLATLERDILSDPAALQALLAFEAEMRAVGCPTLLLWVADPPAEHTLCAIGEHHSYSQPVRGGRRSHCAMHWAPTPTGLGLMPLRPPDWPPPQDG
jgi:hypothetical protein